MEQTITKPAKSPGDIIARTMSAFPYSSDFMTITCLAVSLVMIAILTASIRLLRGTL